MSKRVSVAPKISAYKVGDEASKQSTYIDDDDIAEKSQKLATEAGNAIQTCYKSCFAAVGASLLITIIDGDIWSTDIRDITFIDLLSLVDTRFGLFTLGCGLRHVHQNFLQAVSGEVSRKSRRSIGDERFTNMLRVLCLVWWAIAFNFALVVVSMAATLFPLHCRDKPFCSSLGSKVSSSNAALVAVGILILGRLAVGKYCNATAQSADDADNRRISLIQQKSKRNIKFESSRRLGYLSYRNQALCVLTFGLTSTMELLKWASDPDSHIIGRILSISDVLAPFAITLLLFKLNKSFLRAAIARLRDEGTNSLDDMAYNDLFIAQTEFYEKAAETMREA